MSLQRASNKKTLVNVKGEMSANLHSVESVFRELVKEGYRYRLTSAIANDLGYDVSKILIIPTDEVNACAYPNGYILIYEGLINLLSYEELLSLVGHELVHFNLSHSLNREYTVAKKEKSKSNFGEK